MRLAPLGSSRGFVRPRFFAPACALGERRNANWIVRLLFLFLRWVLLTKTFLFTLLTLFTVRALDAQMYPRTLGTRSDFNWQNQFSRNAPVFVVSDENLFTTRLKRKKKKQPLDASPPRESLARNYSLRARENKSSHRYSKLQFFK